TTGFEIARQNIGSVQNRGWEFMLTLRDRYESFSWAVSGNLSVNKNKVLSLGSQGTEIIKTAGTGHSYFITRIGEPIGSYYFLTQDGVFENQQELDEYPHFANTQPGDFRFVDIDGNDTIDVDADRSIVGSYFPDFIYGMRAEISYAGFDLAINLQGTEGNEILNLLRRYNANMEGNFNNTTEALNRWRSPEEPGNGEVNRANRKATGNNGRTSTWHLEDGSYIRIQNIALGYTLPEKWTKRVLVDRLRFYISVQNLYTWTDYSGYNPEVDLYNSDALTPGVDYGVYPLARTYSLGLNATF
ncbi:MAG TPA: SusC/RagA family protein, partial [Cryomorphaceae bacterium]|nr:SusC/RagA family protein [Cryomorphaceae bacterium]